MTMNKQKKIQRAMMNFHLKILKDLGIELKILKEELAL